MQTLHAIPHGLWLPLITPFRDGKLDEASARRLVSHYAGKPVDGLILAATTGEGLTLDEDEAERLAELSAAERGTRVRLHLGLSGSDTRKGIKALQRTASWPIDGYLITCPYYSRPSQQGLYEHFRTLADSTDKPILVYNIPYRTGVNLGNETLLRLAEHVNIVGPCSTAR
jgi:4-hydroxy-tetrahydrodipicolinate synthase